MSQNRTLRPLRRRQMVRWAGLIVALILGPLAPQAMAAFYSHSDTGALLPFGQYKFQVETQFITSGDDGVNLSARAQGGINDELNWQADLGFGTTDFFAGGMVKWVPIPDVDKQPAIGLSLGVLLASYEGGSEAALRLHPFVSKGFTMDFGDVTPYVALPMGIRSSNAGKAQENDFPVQLALGAEYKPTPWEKLRIIAELGFEVDNSFSYFTIGANLNFDPEAGWIFP